MNQSELCPPGYADYHLYLPPGVTAGKDKLCGQISDLNVNGEPRPYRFPSDAGVADTDYVPVYLITVPYLIDGPGKYLHLGSIGNKDLIKFV
jgi:hypothetical protein